MQLKDIIIGSGEYGIPASAKQYNIGEPKYLRITDITDDGFYNPQPVVSFDFENYSNYEKYKLEYGDIVFARTGNSTGRNYLYSPYDGELYYAGFLIKYRLNINKVIPEFFGLYCKSYDYWNWIEQVSKDGSTRKKMNAQCYLEMPIPEIPISEQKIILGKILPLEEKYKNNNHIIKRLHEYSQLLFHKWFIDFNFPDEEGKPYKDNGGEMYEVDGKMIPVGWEKCTIQDLGLVTMNGDWGNDEYEDGLTEVLCIRGADIPNWRQGDVNDTPIRYIKESNRCEKMLKHGDIVIEASGGSPTQSTGRTVFIRNSILDTIDKPVYCSNFSKIIRPINTEKSTYLYYLLNNLYNRGVFFHYEGKTTGIKNLLLPNLLSNFKIYKPTDDVLIEFETKVGLIVDKIYSTGKENELLKETRNLLIKKLIK